jgi:hypothetical protein
MMAVKCPLNLECLQFHVLFFCISSFNTIEVRYFDFILLQHSFVITGVRRFFIFRTVVMLRATGDIFSSVVLRNPAAVIRSQMPCSFFLN